MNRDQLLKILDATPMEKIEREKIAALNAAKAKNMDDERLNSVYYSKLFIYETKLHRVKKANRR